jgi:hypothetical protein
VDIVQVKEEGRREGGKARIQEMMEDSRKAIDPQEALNTKSASSRKKTKPASWARTMGYAPRGWYSKLVCMRASNLLNQHESSMKAGRAERAFKPERTHTPDRNWHGQPGPWPANNRGLTGCPRSPPITVCSYYSEGIFHSSSVHGQNIL